MEFISHYFTLGIGVFLTLISLLLVGMCKEVKPRNRVRFYIVMDKKPELWLGKPQLGDFCYVNKYGYHDPIAIGDGIGVYGLNPENYSHFSKGEIIEVFLNLEQ